LAVTSFWVKMGAMTAPSADPVSLLVSGEQEQAKSSPHLHAGATGMFDDGVLRITCTTMPPVVVISGEIDESTYSALVEVLSKLAYGRDEIHVDLAGVEYCDIAGLRAIVNLTGEHGRRVVLHQAPPQLKAAIRIVGWDTIPGLALQE
jgi:anti-anti-sigma factor